MMTQKTRMAIVALVALFVLLPISTVYATHGITTSSSRTEVNAGQRVSYTVNVTNTGGDTIKSIVTDFNGFVFAGGSCPSGFSTSNTAQVISCSNGALQNLTSAMLTIDLTAPSSSSGTYYFSTTTTDNSSGTSSSMIGIAVKSPASLSITPQISSKNVAAGSTFTLSATLNNGGQTNVTDPTITIALPSGYTLAQDETRFTKSVSVGSTISWNINAPLTQDTVDRTITLTPAGTDYNTGTAASATAVSVSVRSTAISVTAVVDETSAVYGGRVSVSGYVKEGDTALKTAYVSLVTSFGSRQTTYTDTSGHYSFAVFMPSRSGEQKLDITATYGDMSGSASASVFVGELLVKASISPASVKKGESATIKGDVTKSGLRVSGAEVTTKIGTKTYSTSTDAYGVFSQSVTGAIAGTSRIEVTATSVDGKMGTAILSLAVTGTANKTIEITVTPSKVVPSDNFTVSGSLYSDGEKIAGTVDLKFSGYTTRSIDAPDGDFSVSLQAPGKEGCNDLVASRDGFTGAKIKVCAYLHKDFTISISARKYTPGPNIITITALYEDGSPVSGSLTYGIESTEHTGINMTGAKLIDYNFAKAGKYFVSAYVSDGIRYKMFSKTIEINSTSPTSPTATVTTTPAITANATATPTTGNNTAPATTAGTASARTNLALLLIGGIIILLLFF